MCLCVLIQVNHDRRYISPAPVDGQHYNTCNAPDDGSHLSTALLQSGLFKSKDYTF